MCKLLSLVLTVILVVIMAVPVMARDARDSGSNP